MSIRMMSAAAAAAASLLAFPALAQDAAPADGAFRAPLGEILVAAAEGTCLEALMAPGLFSACQGQIAGMAPALAGLGAIEAMTFVGAEDTPDGPVERWSVGYAGGQTLVWVIGQRQDDGKFRTVGTAG
ncbi:hypothetical protein [Brevundimonas sp.]|uniref:hypothetical protein n=1 Tax=Brevundimonas sp. TaxID=1871086 RepID=UPI002737B797|nr:hypothetical protein [Brevundimonas sp.]MDP3803819.1 hypothetical protein [Brevundimonas sp.]